MRGVGLLQANLIDRGRERGRRDLPMHRRGAVAELGGADGELEAAIVAQRDRSSRRCGRPAARCRSWSARCRRRPASRRRVLMQVPPLPSRARPGRGTGRARRSRRTRRDIADSGGDSMGSPGLTTLRRRMSNGLMPSCFASSSIADFHRDQRLRQAIAAKGARRHGVGIGGNRVDLLVRAVIDAEAIRQRHETAPARRGCHRRRCWRARRAAARSACRPCRRRPSP